MLEKHSDFLELFAPLKDKVWRFCLSLSKNRDDAKDLFQDTIERAYRHFDKLKDRQAFLSYLCSIALRARLLQKKKNSKYISIEEIDWESLVSNSVEAEKRAQIAELYSALDKLSDSLKEPIILQEIMGFSQKEVCEALKINLAALKQRLHRGKAQLRELLEAKQNLEIENINNRSESVWKN